MVNAKNARNSWKGWRATACRFPRLRRPTDGAGKPVAVARWWVFGAWQIHGFPRFYNTTITT